VGRFTTAWRRWSSRGGGGVRIECMRDIFILNEIWVQGNIYFDRNFAWFTYFTSRLVSALTPNYKQHILSLGKVRKVCYS
jgi:hypothetical protein